MLRTVWVLSLLITPAVASAQKADKKPDFSHDVLPLLKAKCASCHTNGKYKGGVSFDTRADLLKSKAAVPGKAAASEIITRVVSKDDDVRMPPPKALPLTEAEVSILKAWIDDGLKWEEGFTFVPNTYVRPLKLRQVTLPAAQAGRDHPIDRIVDAYFVANKIPRPKPLDDVAFLRRAYEDLIGLPPAASELQPFLNDTNPTKRTKLIEKLLAEDRSYADHWLAFWNDLLRNEYKGTGYIDGGRKQISAWLYKSLLDNKPYNQFTRELINPTPESEGFIRGIKWRGAVNASQIVELQFSQNIGQVFFGANLKCASCHDSFIDSWKLNDAYGLAAVVADKPLEINQCDKGTGKMATTKFLFPELGTIDATLPKPKRLEQLASLVTSPENGRFSRTIANRIWHRLMGHGLVHPVDLMDTKPWNEDLLEHLAIYLTENNYDLRKLIAHITTSQTYQATAVPLAKEVASDAYIFRGPELKRMSAEQFIDAVWMLTSTAPAKATAPVKFPAFPATVPAERQLVRTTLVDCDILMRSLGRPNREQVVTTRPDQLTTLQALDLSNGATLTTILSKGAANILKANPGATNDQLAAWVFTRALSRNPSADELAASRQLLGDKPTTESLADLLWAVIMLPEFQLIR